MCSRTLLSLSLLHKQLILKMLSLKTRASNRACLTFLGLLVSVPVQPSTRYGSEPGQSDANPKVTQECLATSGHHEWPKQVAIVVISVLRS